MKTLYLLRHGQAPPRPKASDDFHRPLDKTGERQAEAIGLRLVLTEAKPELIVASPADRTRQTASIVARALSYPEEQIRYIPEIYAADVRLLSKLIQANPSSLNTILMVGHNPAFTDFGEWLTGKHYGHLPACGLLVIAFDAPDWTGLDRGKGRLLWRTAGG